MNTRPFSTSISSSLLVSAVLLSGCGAGIQSNGGGVSALAVQGRLMGGQQPINHATIEFYGVSNMAYSGASTALTPTIQSDANGAFQLPQPISCPTTGQAGGTLVYIVATGGDPGLDETNGTINNSASVLMAALGRCDSLNASTNIELSELSTVAAVWTLAPFMKSYDHVGTSPGNAAGLINAFGMANTLVSYATGNMPGESAAAGTTVPTVELSNLANVLASCVNTKGGVSGDASPCGNLFSLATPPPGGVVPHGLSPHASGGNPPPTDTVEAALDIALNPSNNVSSIATLPSPQAPFVPAVYTGTDWTVAINFPVAGARTTNGMAFDSKGNLWVAASDALYELSPEGDTVGTTLAMAGNSVAIDASDNVWATTAPNVLSEMLANTSTVATFTATNGFSTTADGLAIDGSGNPWYTCDFCSDVYKLNISDSSIGTFATAGTQRQTNISIDGGEHVWLGNSGFAQMDVFNSNGTVFAGSPFTCANCGHPAYVANDHAGNAWIVGNDLTYMTPSSAAPTNFDTTAGGLFEPNAVAVDGAGNAWVANAVGAPGTAATGQPGSISEFTQAGAPVTPATGYLSSTLATPQNIAIDGSGNVWLRNTGAATVTTFVGAAVPVVTPLALGVKNNSLGSQP